MRRDCSPYAFPLPVFFLCATEACCRCFSSCALRNVGAFSQGRDRCTISFRLDVVALADNGCARGIPYLIRYAFPSNPCPLRCLTESCLKLAPHSRHIAACLVMLFLQLPGAGSVSGGATATL